jgi:hypothetical protein
MIGAVHAGSGWSRPGAPTHVLCVACSFRFDVDGAVSGDRATCPVCRAVVEIDEYVVERRRAPSTRAWVRLSSSRRISREQSRRALAWCGYASIAFAIAFAAVRWSDAIVDYVLAAKDLVVRLF